jgi:O-antigen/teichoic acid export membrane protein
VRTLFGQTIVVSGVRIFYLGLWFVAITAAYRHLGALQGGAAQAGLLAFALASIKMVTTAFGDPLDLDVVRRVPPILGAAPDRAVEVWRAAQQIRIGFALAVATLAAVFAAPIAGIFLHDRTWSAPIALAGAAAAMEFLYRGYLSDYQSREHFNRLLALEGMLQGFRILSVIALLVSGRLTATSFLIAYALSTFLVCVAAYAVSDGARKRIWKFSAVTSIETWRYVRWVAPAMILSAVIERLDIFLLTSLRGPSESGLYGALMPLLLVPEMVIGFAMVVLQPRVADLYAKGGLFDLWANVCRITAPVAVLGCFVVFFFADTIINLTIGPAYLESTPVLKVLTIAVMSWFAVVPVALSFVVMTQPRATLAICVIQAVIVVASACFLIPAYGALGAALSVLLMRLATGAIICAAAYYQLRAQVYERAQTS